MADDTNIRNTNKNIHKIINRRNVQRKIVELLPEGMAHVIYYDSGGYQLHEAVEPVTPETLGERIAVARQELGMSQAALAQAVGVSVDAVQLWTANKRRPNSPTLTVLSQVLQVRKEWLLTGEGDKKGT